MLSETPGYYGLPESAVAVVQVVVRVQGERLVHGVEMVDVVLVLQRWYVVHHLTQVNTQFRLSRRNEQQHVASSMSRFICDIELTYCQTTPVVWEIRIQPAFALVRVVKGD